MSGDVRADDEQRRMGVEYSEIPRFWLKADCHKWKVSLRGDDDHFKWE